MQSLVSLWISLWNLVIAAAEFLAVLVQALAPWTPLLAWIAFWLLAVNWKQLYPILMKGGLIAVVLTALMAVLVWSSIAPPEAGSHRLYGLEVNNLVGKTVYVTGLVVIAMLCGSVQLSGACNACCWFEEPTPPAADEGHTHH